MTQKDKNQTSAQANAQSAQGSLATPQAVGAPKQDLQANKSAPTPPKKPNRKKHPTKSENSQGVLLSQEQEF